MKHLFNTSTHLLLLERSVQTNDNHHLNKDLGAVVSHLPLNGNHPLDGIPIMSTEDFIVWDYIVQGWSHITLLLRQGDSIENIQYTVKKDMLSYFFKDTELRDMEYFFDNQSRANILYNLTEFINAIKSKHKVGK